MRLASRQCLERPHFLDDIPEPHPLTYWPWSLCSGHASCSCHRKQEYHGRPLGTIDSLSRAWTASTGTYAPLKTLGDGSLARSTYVIGKGACPSLNAICYKCKTWVAGNAIGCCEADKETLRRRLGLGAQNAKILRSHQALHAVPYHPRR